MACYVWDEIYVLHDTGGMMFDRWIEPMNHWETQQGKRRMHTMLYNAGLLPDRLTVVKAREATEEDVLRVHTKEYFETVKSGSDQRLGAVIGDEAFVRFGGFKVAMMSAGGALAGVDAIYDEEKPNRCYALIRPPGHHATRASGMGFCIFNNIAIAAEYALLHKGAKKIAIVDFDVHHGNGTQDHFYERDDVLFISIHQAGNYPLHSGEIEEIGKGKGEYYNVNVPLPPGSGFEAYEETFKKVVIPLISRFEPDLILCSCGFDASFLDPLGRMMLSSDSFRKLTKHLTELADKHCEGRLLFCHEGGYSEVYVPFCGLAVVEELAHESSNIEDPFLKEINAWGYQELSEHQRNVIEKVRQTFDIKI